MKIHIYTDGAASGNPGPGGYGIIMQVEGSSYEKEFSEGFRHTTNNRMELMAVIEALNQLTKPNQDVTIHTDSKYVVDAVEKKWVFGWVKKGFIGKKNSDLWRQFLTIYPKHSIKFNWIKGHAGHIQNERADKLAVAAGKQKELKIDLYYEQNKD